MATVRLIAILSALLVSSVSCASEQRVIYYYLGCDDPEVRSDIEHSVVGLEKFAEVNHINLVHKEEPNKCGYLFILGSASRSIESAMTDVDLMMFSQEFFNLGAFGGEDSRAE